MTEEEFQKALKTPNCELSDEVLREKMAYLWGCVRFLSMDGVDDLADARVNDALLCQKELDERAGIFGKKYAFVDLSKYSKWRQRKPTKKRKRRKKTSRRRTSQCQTSTESKRKSTKRVPS